MSIEYSPLYHADLTEQTYRVLRDKILRRQLSPGEKIVVEEAARGLGVSRTPVITALQKLASEGLVEIVPRRGTFVTELTARDVAELFDIRLMIEVFAAEYILRSGQVARLLDETGEAMEGMEQAVDDDEYRDYEAFMANDRDLHLVLVKLAENRHLFEMYSNMNVHMQVARTHYLNSVETARQAQREHGAIMEAFSSGDLNRVREALSTHIGNVKERILEILEERGGKL
jgi:DNA-binding GntR family transcriptional regulator